MTRQMQYAVQSGIMHICESTQEVGANFFGCDTCTYICFAWEKWHTQCDQNAHIAKWKRATNYRALLRKITYQNSFEAKNDTPNAIKMRLMQYAVQSNTDCTWVCVSECVWVYLIVQQYLMIVVPHLQWPTCSDIVRSSSKSSKLKLVGLFCSKLKLLGLFCSKLMLRCLLLKAQAVSLFLDAIEVSFLVNTDLRVWVSSFSTERGHRD